MKNCAIVSPTNRIIRIFTEPETIWSRNEIFNQGRIVTLEPEKKTFATAFVSPISANPKVRHFKYSFELIVPAGIPAKMRLLRFEEAHGRTLDQELEYWATEFIENNSKTISGFYNRQDWGQQNKFHEMAKEFINPKIKDSGTQITIAKFDLPS